MDKVNMFSRVHKLVTSYRGLWINVLLLAYPFLLLSSLVYSGEVRFRSSYDFVKSAIFNIAFFCSGIFLLATLRSARIRWMLLKIVFLLQFLLVFVSIYHFCLYGQFIGSPAVYALLDTNFSESLQFALAYLRLDYLLLALIAAAPALWSVIHPVLLPRIQTENFFHILIPVFFFGLICTAAFSDWRPYLTEHNLLIYLSKSVNSALKEKDKLEKLYVAPPVLDTKPVLLSDKENKVTHVLVISESINRSHMSLYGYPRKTNVELERKINQLYIVKDACSLQNTTVPALKDMLTFATAEHPQRLYEIPNLIQIMQAAGFETYWLSNQQEVGFYDSFAAIFSKSADHRVFINRRGWEEAGSSLDEELVEPFQDVLKGKPVKKFIVLHLIGAHFHYAWRYPQAYEVFDNLDDVPREMKRFIQTPDGIKTYNQYDNAILFNDHVVSRLLDSLNENEEVTFTYIADHGEAVGEKGEFFGHAEHLQYRAINEIPLFFWLSEKSKSHAPEKVDNLRFNLTSPFQSDQSVHTLLNLYDVHYPLLNYEHSLFSREFTPKKRHCDDLK
ncbi:phosphoethanolamine transferase [Oxalobacteraceae bacterium R-40]|uniref:Phosphoethanolamine transferase n=1 Tax=Keguizhuia sedimenti TaxID=3064264 RepID=A0ABU1BVY0_9BURK|nr:phosphoethanolamine transferase [Oxalobacteraceae bacterium R-40]